MNNESDHFEVVIIGGGISGIGAAIHLQRLGIDNFALLEKADSLGGTWRANTYPGCACDVPSGLYSYSFAANPDWTRLFAEQPEIREYIENTAGTHGVDKHVRFGVEMLSARWDASQSLWKITTSSGELTARFVIAAAGPWNEPLTPAIPGLEAFEGEVFHSSQWNHDYDLTGKRVAVVGTGASAVQFVPRIVSQVSALHLYQRTAQWVLPKPDHYVPRIERSVMRFVPGAQKALRSIEYGIMEALGLGFRNPWILRIVQKLGSAQLRLQVRDPKLRKALTPDYTLGCKRLLMSNSYYPALGKPNVSVHANAVEQIRGNTVIGADGVEAEVDAIIFGTGFHILDMPIASKVFDGEGRSLDDHWQGSPQAYFGSAVSGFPNAFILLGPSLGTGHTSAFMILEAQLNYVAQAIGHARRHGWQTIDVREEVQAAFNSQVQEALGTTVYNAGGCESYFFDVNGRNSFNWPWSSGAMRRRLRDFDPYAYNHTSNPESDNTPPEPTPSEPTPSEPTTIPEPEYTA
ncbi:NAD(P)/FAD-dependent oxidoreductase [Rhodococcus sp. WS1]|uniref:flavin-containing monooxygenase n=1 Tax=unclassified Rhodococcus (in: high G+C Gram-positive bacteria) TaxID=192944 RepID=UPI001143E517|nr:MULTISPECIES: NAD(P)/FAD-dependent oxidoreductase [unclassified Rhodococcus (in: high G+C Gram-positive bacteria)]MCW0190850.1 NAD(P)/FAD-dependent oxidoreductase [Rhodococcus sp. (in: high G+C Gram-positive bacteria)]ROZ56232.1 NAD(P)/FAD-dependent oxidoreductase [Rhodococcus sp. WS1]TQC40421.1 NAD(P)/FAD-dependent oxidoreductase [Rhodococcus sp. WS7]